MNTKIKVLISLVVILLGVGSSGSSVAQAEPVTILYAHSGTIDGAPVTVNMNLSIDSVTGAYTGSYEMLGPQAALAAERRKLKRWLLKKGWLVKYFLDCGSGSLYQQSGFNLLDTSSSMFSFGDIVTSSEIISGTSTIAMSVGTFTVITAGLGPEEADPLISISTFDPGSPGQITFTTQHLFADGQTALGNGIIFGALQTPLIISQTMLVTIMDDDPNDGRVGGTLSGQVTNIPEPATMLLLGTGLAGVGAAVRKHRKAKTEDKPKLPSVGAAL